MMEHFPFTDISK